MFAQISLIMTRHMAMPHLKGGEKIQSYDAPRRRVTRIFMNISNDYQINFLQRDDILAETRLARINQSNVVIGNDS